ncbi:MAG: hypothetical protein J5879_00785 [Clostridia bacterium]|nr:hypothetical protein [Clostridia bacterium]
MKKTAAVILIVLTVLYVCSCAAPDDVVTGGATSAETEEVTETGEITETEDAGYEAELPEERFEGVFNILIEGSFWSPEESLYCENTSDDPVFDAVWRRQTQIKEQFGAELMVTPSADTTSTLKKSVKSGDASFDAIITRMPLIAASASNGDLMDLKEAAGLDLTKKYWDQSASEAFSVGERVFCTAGDIINTEDEVTWIMMFNKTLARNFDLEDLYKVVKEGRWTFDYFYGLLKETGASKDNGDGTWDYKDSYALSTHRDMAYGLFYAAGLTFITKDADNLPVLNSAESEKIQKVLDYSLKVMREDNLTLDAHKWVSVHPHATDLTYEAFTEDRALFYAEVLYYVAQLRTMDTDFGILPLPKYDEKQKDYISFVNPAASLVGIPIYQKNKDNARRSGTLLEAMAYYGYKYLTPAYLDKQIKGKSTRDVESIEMIDIIMKHRAYDLELIHDWGNLATSYSNLVFDNKNNYASVYKKCSKTAEKKINTFLTSIEKNMK